MKTLPPLPRIWMACLAGLVFAGFPAGARLNAVSERPDREDVLQALKAVADWELEKDRRLHPTKWHNIAFYNGLLELAEVSGEARYREAVEAIGEGLAWRHGSPIYNADDYGVGQVWLKLYTHQPEPERLEPTKALLDHIRINPITLDLAFNVDQQWDDYSKKNRWSWADALYMAPAVWVQLYRVTGDPVYLYEMNRMFWETTDYLFNPTDGLFYRDNRFFDRRAANGKNIYWGRGNGWVYAGFPAILPHLPADFVDLPRYRSLYFAMTDALVERQRPDGFWPASLEDPSFGDYGESSATAFITYGLAWGIRAGWLNREDYLPAVLKAWQAMAGRVSEDGRFTGVQSVAAQPRTFDLEQTHVYASGAFLQAGSEILRLLDSRGTGTGKRLAEKVPYLRQEPRAYFRHIPERMEDVAWENDRIAFRTYGPSLRDSAEDSGFDAWLKKVPYPIIEKWYAEDRAGKSYHADQGEGLDCYKVGSSRGVGGIGIWTGETLHTSNVYRQWPRTLEFTSDGIGFQLYYRYQVEGREIDEIKRIYLEKGSSLFHVRSSFRIDGEPARLTVGVGLARQTPEARVLRDPANRWMALWETLPDGLGQLGQGMVFPEGTRVVEVLPDYSSGGFSHLLALVDTDENGEVRYAAGYGWDQAPYFKDVRDWSTYLEAAGFPDIPGLHEPIRSPRPSED